MTAGDLIPIQDVLSEIESVVGQILSEVVSDTSPDLSSIQSVLEDIQAAVSSMVHPLLSTPVRDYTVTEGLLLLILLFLILRELARLMRILWNKWF